MTIPIIPGPFSFLETAGRGVGNTLQAKEGFRRKQLQEDMTSVGMLLQLINSGQIKRQELGSEKNLELFNRLNISLSDDALRPSLAEQDEESILAFSEAVQPRDRFAISQPVGAGVVPGLPRVPTAKRRPETVAEGRPRREAAVPDPLRGRLGLQNEAEIAASKVAADQAGTTAQLAAAVGQIEAVTTLTASSVLASKTEWEATGVPFFDDKQMVNPQAREAAWQRYKRDAAARGIGLTERDRVFVDAEIARLQFREIELDIARAAADLRAFNSDSQRQESLILRVSTLRRFNDQAITEANSVIEDNKVFYGVALQSLGGGANLDDITGMIRDAYIKTEQAQKDLTDLAEKNDNLEKQLQDLGINILGGGGASEGAVIASRTTRRGGAGTTQPGAGRPTAPPIQPPRFAGQVTFTDVENGTTTQLPMSDFVDRLLGQANPAEALLLSLQAGEIDGTSMFAVINHAVQRQGIPTDVRNALLGIREDLTPTDTIGR